MRCCCCNRNLNDFESTMKHPETGEYLDTCQKCLPDTGINPIIRKDLMPQQIIDDEDDLVEIDMSWLEDDE